MKSIYYIASLLIPFSAMVISLTSCSGKQEKSNSTDSLPEDVREVAVAIIEESPEKFAGAMTYPISRPYPLRDVKDSSEMVKYYPKIVDEKLKKAVKEAADTSWNEDGWRGWTLDEGQYLWIDAGKVYEINYLSDEESLMLDSLRMEEISSLAPSLRKGWTPVMCVIDSVDGVIFRIDSDDVNSETPKMRLAGYTYTINQNNNLSAMPALLLYGNLEEEGTLESRFYHFSDNYGNSAEYTPDAMDDAVPTLEVRHKGNKVIRYRVKPGYWLDYAKPSQQPDSTMVNYHTDARQNHGKSLTVPPEKRMKSDSTRNQPMQTDSARN